FFFFLRLALLDHLGLGGRGRRGGGGLGRLRLLLRLQRHDVHDHHVGVADRRPLHALDEVAHAHALVQHQLADVHVDVLGDVAGQTVDLDLTIEEVDDPAVLIGALRFTFEYYRNGDGDRIVHRDLVYVLDELIVID